MYFPYLKEAWFITVNELKELISKNNFKLSENSGDIDSETKGYLLPRNEYFNNFKVINVDYEW
jgi:hypothetical protein